MTSYLPIVKDDTADPEIIILDDSDDENDLEIICLGNLKSTNSQPCTDTRAEESQLCTMSSRCSPYSLDLSFSSNGSSNYESGPMANSTMIEEMFDSSVQQEEYCYNYDDKDESIQEVEPTWILSSIIEMPLNVNFN